MNVVFLGGADFDSTPPLGTTDRTRYIKVTTLEKARRPELHTWLEQAGPHTGLDLEVIAPDRRLPLGCQSPITDHLTRCVCAQSAEALLRTGWSR